MKCSDIRIIGWEALSSLGVGSATPDAPGLSGRGEDASASRPEHFASEDWPQDIEYLAIRLDVPAILGQKGIRTIDRTAALALCTSELLNGRLAVPQFLPAEKIGFAIGTSTGSVHSTSDFARESLTQPRPYLVNPMKFPNTMMNYTAAQCGIRFKARSVNATVAGGRLSGLLAIKYACSVLLRGYADLMYAGGVEELCPETAWAHRALVQAGVRRRVPIGEGCGMFACAGSAIADVLAPDGSTADVLSVEYGRYAVGAQPSRDELVGGLVECVGRALAQAGINAMEVSNGVFCGAADTICGELERDALTHVFRSGISIHGEKLIHHMGDTYSAAFSLGLAWLFTSMEKAPSYGIVIASNEDGHAGCIILRVHR